MGKAKSSKYVAKKPDKDGFIQYTEEEDSVWHDLITRQVKALEGRACQEVLDGLERLNLPTDRVPQCKEVSEVLYECTGWQVEPVPALIPFDAFFNLLANRKFPAASFIRKREEMDYLQEPDIFHEIFGHTPLLTFKSFADFTEAYGRAGVTASKEDRIMLARLYWFTAEFGLIRQPEGPRIYGGGITSSYGETVYAVESDEPERVPFDPIEALRTPYRIDIFQPIYFVIESPKELYQLAHDEDLGALIRKARSLGEHPPKFPVQDAS